MLRGDRSLRGDYVRRGVAEFIGTYALVFVAAASVAFARTLTDIALAYGLVVAVFVIALGSVSGGHFNPATTLGYLVARRLEPTLAALYWVVQLAASAAAALTLKWVLPAAVQSQAKLGVPTLGASIGPSAAVIVEALLTFFLVFVVFAVAVDPRGVLRTNGLGGLVIGLTIAADVLMAGVLTGAAMNPARAFGPQLVGDHWSHFWVWYVGPLAGAVIAATVYELLYLRGDRPETPAEPDLEPAPDLPATSG